MTSCEKCWGDAFRRALGEPWHTQHEHYLNLLRERADNPCTPEEQRGFIPENEPERFDEIIPEEKW